MAKEEGNSILISSHISSDLESICDDLYMIHQGTIILHEDTDVLLSDYALLKVDDEAYAGLDKQYLLRSKKESYGYSCLTNQKQYYAENYPPVSYTHLNRNNHRVDGLWKYMRHRTYDVCFRHWRILYQSKKQHDKRNH